MTPWQWLRFACGIWTEGDEPWLERCIAHVGSGDERAWIVPSRCRATRNPADRVDAERVGLPPLAAIIAFGLFPLVDDEIWVRRVGKCHPREDAARLVRRHAGR